MENSSKPLAIVTGASSGIGLELAKQFAEHGFDLVVAADGTGIHDAARDLEAMGAAVKPVQVDLAQADGVDRLYSEATSQGRPIDAIAINAGVGINGDFARTTNWDDELKLINLNVVSTVHLAKLALRDMVQRNEGRVLFTSSIAGTTPGPFEAVYNASKAFVSSFADAIRNELNDTNITITTLMPGATETNFFHRAGMEDTKLGAQEKDDPAEVARDGFEALMSGKHSVVAGAFKNKVMAMAGKLMPETAAKIHRKESEPGSASH